MAPTTRKRKPIGYRMSRFMGLGAGYQKMMFRTIVRRMTTAPKGATRFQNGVVASPLSSWGVSDQTRPRSCWSVLVDVVAREMTIVATKHEVHAQMAVQKFWAISLG